MTKQEAIQQQIDYIMDTFEFNKVESIMKLLDWKWHENELPDEYDIRQHARYCLKMAAGCGGYSTGGFAARKTEGRDEDGPWLILNLSFGLDTINDGVTYQEAPQEK
jgi:hypothetical protein